MGHWTIEVQTIRPVSAGAVVWRMEGKLCLTLMAKATFGLVPEGMARLVAPTPLSEDDLFDRGDPTASLAQASDLAPYRPRVDVVLTGHAHAPDGAETPALAVRLSVYGDSVSLEKTLHVHGDRADIGAAPRRFTKMPLSWERAIADPDHNPVGVLPGAGRMPNVVDPTDPTRPAGFGPIAPHWGVRARHLQGGGAPVRRGSSVSVPSGLDWSFYQSAPIDQQIPALEGNEEIILDNLLASAQRLRTRLPSARGVARLYGADAPPAGFPLELEPDTLMIDGDRQVCSIVWRGCLSIVGQEEDLSQLRAVIGVELPGYPMPWDSAIVSMPAAPGSPAPRPDRRAETSSPVASSRGGSTVAFSPEEAQRLIAQAGAKAVRMPDFGPPAGAGPRSTRPPPPPPPRARPPLDVSDPGEETTAVAPIPRTAPPPMLGDEDSTTALMNRRDAPPAVPSPSEPPDSAPSATLALSPEEAGILLDKPVLPFHTSGNDLPPNAPDEPLKRSETLVIEIEPAPPPPGRR